MDNKNKKPRSLYAMWLEAHKMNALPAEWKLAHNFLTWATANGYKPDYGYEGAFTPDNLLAAIKTPREISRKETAGEFNIPEKLLDGHDEQLEVFANAMISASKADFAPPDVETLVKTMNKDALIKLAQETPGVVISGAETKRQLAELIIAAEKKSGGSE